MSLTTSGVEHIAGLLAGEALTPFDEANAHIGVGDSSAAFSISQTDLQAAVNKFRKQVNATYPTRFGAQLVFQALFDEAEANFDWEEWGIFNDPAAGEMLVRFVESLGTKPSTQSWLFTVTIQLAAV